ncbi:glycosyltransferase [Halobacillus litoralis]|uniref:glycosyltransferase n=1 Tax=Halobacillus litoralis TaxID=45668 RepID=UPI00136E3BA5|nr:hypothetical protein [Halobacillus litoralis]MYL36414.1 hypothetical protein [Halobacillus litoralis]
MAYNHEYKYSSTDLKLHNELKIAFVCKEINMNRGSYRIWVKYLSETINNLGIQSTICALDSDRATNDANVIIFDKGITGKEIALYKSKLHNIEVTGAINPPVNSNLSVDFVIVGSREEEASLSNYSRVIYVPLIELPIHALKPKEHEENNTINVCYHGNSLHLSSFKSSGLKSALEQFQKELNEVNKKLLLTVVSNKKKPRWLIGKPKNLEINYLKYDWIEFPQVLLKQDIGIIPNGLYKNGNFTSKLFRIMLNMELSQDDIIIRMKNKSNFGRLLVFMQAGIPTIADMTPSHMDLLGDPQNGYCAFNKNSWLKALRKLADTSNRNMIAQNAKCLVNSRYDPAEWGQRFIYELNNIIFHKKK